MLVIDDSANPSDLRSGSCYLWTTPLALRLYNICSQILIWFWRVWRHGRHGNVWVLEKLNMRQQTQETHCFKILFGIGYISTKQPKGGVFPPKIRSYGSWWNTISSAFFFEKMQSMNSSGAQNPLRAPRVFLIWLGGAKKNYINTHKTLTSLMFTAPCPALCNAPPPSSSTTSQFMR